MSSRARFPISIGRLGERGPASGRNGVIYAICCRNFSGVLKLLELGVRSKA
jgi:hypothetical protein